MFYEYLTWFQHACFGTKIDSLEKNELPMYKLSFAIQNPKIVQESFYQEILIVSYKVMVI